MISRDNQIKEAFFTLLAKYETSERGCIDNYSTNIEQDTKLLQEEIKDISDDLNYIMFLL